MSALAIAEVVFFLVYGISHFMPFKFAGQIAAIAAIVVGVLMLVNR
jgi:hypothetical protein